MSIVNHGEAVARDVEAISSTSLAINGQTDWSADTLAPGERVTFTVPLVENVGVTQNRDGAEEFHYSGRGEDFNTEMPTLTLHWVQAPGSTACSLESTAPPSPALGPQSEPPASLSECSESATASNSGVIDQRRRDHRTTPQKNPVRSDTEKTLDAIRKQALRDRLKRESGMRK